MESIPSCLYLDPGWEKDADFKQVHRSASSHSNSMVGKHCILELYNCEQEKLNDEAFVRTSLTTAAKLAGATVINLMTHRFEPQGVTGLALLAESHISIHTWPENGYAAVDVFTCGDHTMPEIACNILVKEFTAKKHLLKCFFRETPPELASSIQESSSSLQRTLTN